MPAIYTTQYCPPTPQAIERQPSAIDAVPGAIMQNDKGAASVSMARHLQDAGVVPPNRGKRYSATLKANVVEELKKPGANARRIAERFRVGESTVASWRLQHIGRKQVRVNTRLDKPVDRTPPSAPDLPVGVREVASALAEDGAGIAGEVTLTRQEARALALIVRDTVKRLSGADEMVLGRMALLALKLAG